jgi:hypothetical protein
MRLKDGARKQQKKETRIEIYYNDNKIPFESGIRNYLNHEKRISEFEIKIKNFNERSEKVKIKNFIILDNRFRNLEIENKKLNDIIKNRDRIIINFNNQTAVLERERTEFKRIFDLRDSTIAY